MSAENPPSATVAVSPLIPIQGFAMSQTLAEPMLSPDGTVVAAHMRKNGEQFVLIHKLFGKDSATAPTRVFNLGKATLNWTEWANDQFVVASVRQGYDFRGDELFYDRMVVIDREKSTVTPLGPKRSSFSGDDVIFWAKDGSYVLLSVARSWIDWPEVVRVDIPSNTITKIERQHDGVFQWFANSRGEVVAGIGVTYGRRLKVIYRPDPGKPFETILRIKIDGDNDEAEQVFIARIDGDTQKGYVVSRRGGDLWGLHEYDFRSKTFGAALFTHPDVDLDNFGFTRDGQLRWVSYIDDRQRIKWFADEEQRFYQDLEKAVPDKLAFVVSTSANKEVKVVKTSAPTDPGTFYVYRADSGKMVRVASVNEALKDQRLASTEYVSYVARDGLKIPAYLTLPVGRAPAGLPLVVVPHGGPFVRDEWDYDFLTQYLANRGYAVLQPNFRGSAGYGLAFEKRGYHEWGKGMQDDVDDGVKWLVDSGRVDPGRVCMLGWSYGGYAAQVAAFRNPETYRCAVSIAGISDLGAMIAYDRRFMFGSSFRKWRAKIQGDSPVRELKSVSSLTQVRNIAIPLLVVHGTDDDNVPVSQSDKLTKALKNAGKPFDYIRIKDGDHSLQDEKQRAELLQGLDKFLAAHNPTDVLRPSAPDVPLSAPESP
jgi:dipeptidyl aminopeptidase/acylaminoacyl peptidase